mmetsp:Transcript_7841/g.23579  ORF Transcript_7841/g.23579 Transcript_7841/m.23579 type:complete len:278 (-) Transcript_7841:258-1091(-)
MLTLALAAQRCSAEMHSVRARRDRLLWQWLAATLPSTLRMSQRRCQTSKTPPCATPLSASCWKWCSQSHADERRYATRQDMAAAQMCCCVFPRRSSASGRSGGMAWQATRRRASRSAMPAPHVMTGQQQAPSAFLDDDRPAASGIGVSAWCTRHIDINRRLDSNKIILALFLLRHAAAGAFCCCVRGQTLALRYRNCSAGETGRDANNMDAATSLAGVDAPYGRRLSRCCHCCWLLSCLPGGPPFEHAACLHADTGKHRHCAGVHSVADLPPPLPSL